MGPTIHEGRKNVKQLELPAISPDRIPLQIPLIAPHNQPLNRRKLVPPLVPNSGQMVPISAKYGIFGFAVSPLRN